MEDSIKINDLNYQNMKFDREILKKYLDVTNDTYKNAGRLYGPVRQMLGITDISHLD